MAGPAVGNRRTLAVRSAAHVAGAARILTSLLVAGSVAQAQSSGDARAADRTAFDLVVANGRVIDPETGLDGVRSIGIRAGRIAAIARTPLRGRTMIDARGLVVAPGFICSSGCESLEFRHFQREFSSGRGLIAPRTGSGSIYKATICRA